MSQLETRTARRLATTNLVAQGSALGCVSVASLLVARSGGAAVLGQYALLRVLPWLFAVILSCGLPTASAYFLAGEHRNDRRTRPTLAAMAVAGAALAALAWAGLSLPLRNLFLKGVPAHLVALMAVVVITQLLTVTAKACCQGSGDISGANLVIVAEEFWFVPVYVAVVHLHIHGISAVAISLLLSGGLAAATGMIRLVQQGFFGGWGLPSKALAREVAAYGARGQLGNLLWLMNLRFDFLLLGAIAGPTVLGIYAVASKFAELMRLVPTAVNYVLYPRFARLGKKPAVKDARHLLPRSTALTLALTPVVAVASAIALPILYGSQFHAAVLPAEIILIGLSIEGAAAVTSAFLLGIGRPGLNSWGMAAGVVVTVSMDVLLIPRYGARGAALTSAVAYLTTTCVLFLIFRAQCRRITSESDVTREEIDAMTVHREDGSRSDVLAEPALVGSSANAGPTISVTGRKRPTRDRWQSEEPVRPSAPPRPGPSRSPSFAMTKPKWLGTDTAGMASPRANGGGRSIAAVPGVPFSRPRVADTTAHQGSVARLPGRRSLPGRPGELYYEVPSAAEPPGAPLTLAATVQVRLALAVAEDEEILLSRGLTAMRQARVVRLLREAQEQGGLLTVDDLAFLTCSSRETVEADLGLAPSRSNAPVEEGLVADPVSSAEPVQHGVSAAAGWSAGPVDDGVGAADLSAAPIELDPAAVGDGRQPGPSRPPVEDVGPSLSRKATVVHLYLWGLAIGDIEFRTGHPDGTIRRYLSDFHQVAALHIQGVRLPEIRATTGISPSLIAEYTDLYERARHEFPAASRLNELLEWEPAEGRKRGRR